MASPLDLLYPTFCAALEQAAPFESAPHVAVAVSGGSDSLALALLTQRWVAERHGSLIALTVDHQLRPESAKEAEQVGAWLAQHRIPHRILVWKDIHKPTHNIQALARQARYECLLEACQHAHILHLLLGHQQEDVAETSGMRWLRASSVEGLAAMPYLRAQQGVRLIRPLLTTRRETLRAWLDAQNQPWIDDASNENLRFKRVQARRFLSDLQQHPIVEGGCVTGRLAQAATHCARASEALDQLLLPYVVKGFAIHPYGYASIDRTVWNRLPEEGALKLLAKILKLVGGEENPPRFTSLKALYNHLQQPDFTGKTLAGCTIRSFSRRRDAHPHRQSAILILREAGACETTAFSAESSLCKMQWDIQWDRRFQVVVKQGEGAMLRDPIQVCPMTPAILKWIQSEMPEQAKKWRTIPKPVLFTLPVLRTLDFVLAIPHIGYIDPRFSRLQIYCSFHPSQGLTDGKKRINQLPD